MGCRTDAEGNNRWSTWHVKKDSPLISEITCAILHHAVRKRKHGSRWSYRLGVWKLRTYLCKFLLPVMTCETRDKGRESFKKCDLRRLEKV